MSDKLKSLEIKRLIQEYVFIRSDLEYKQTIVDENTTIFLEKIYAVAGKEQPITSTNIEDKAYLGLKNKISEGTKIEEFIPEINKTVKRLYREISKRAHPDRDPYCHYNGIFSRATAAYESGNLIELCEICEKIDVPYKIDEGDLIAIKENLAKVRGQIKSLETTYVYLWCINLDEKIRNMIIHQYIKSNRELFK
jgi:hypothetical protein